MPEKKVDLRVQRTKENIRRVFEEMICEMDYEEMSIKELTQRAKVFLPWSDRPLRGERGDWLAANVNSPQCVFIVERTRFATSYLLVEEKEAVSFS